MSRTFKDCKKKRRGKSFDNWTDGKYEEIYNDKQRCVNGNS